MKPYTLSKSNGGNGHHRGRPCERELRTELAILAEAYGRVQARRREILKAASHTRATLYRESGARP